MTQPNLAEGSRSYHDLAHVYERFSQVEDAPDKILKFLKSPVECKDVLDVGCGTGKYAVTLAPAARSYYGVDISPQQLVIAKKKANGLQNVTLRCSSAENIDLPDESIDTVISTWVIGTIAGIERRAKAIFEATRILRKSGSIYLVENDVGGEFEYIRGRFPNDSRTQEYNGWLEQEMGFVPVSRFDTSFGFESVDEAKEVIGTIWGEEAASRVLKRDIEHRIVVYERKK